MEPAKRFTIQCIGEEHEIWFFGNGQIYLPNHHYGAELVAEKFGGKLPPCCKIAKQLRNNELYFDRTICPLDLLAYNAEMQAKRAERVAKFSLIEERSKNRLTFPERYILKLLPIAKRALERTEYRAFYGGYIRNFYVSAGSPNIWDIPCAGYCGCCGECCGCSGNCYQSNQIGVTIDWTWHKVLSRGIEVVDGRFVIKVLDETEDYTEVLVGMQDDKCAVRPHRAIIRRRQEPHLSWMPLA